MGPAALAKVLESIHSQTLDERVLVGLDGVDDAGIFQINEEQALVQTVDFFTPVVDNPHDFGRIAAANALSDIYAMGAEPLIALNIVSFPSQKISLEVLADILDGGREKVQEAGATIIGGHTIEDQEPKYGLAVTGLVHPKRIVKTSGAEPEDVLVLSKPIGAGVLSTGIKRGKVTAEEGRIATEVMAALNARAARILSHDRVHAMTDVTGFGLLGHLMEMLQPSGVAAELEIPPGLFLPGSKRLAKEGVIPGGSKANLEYLQNEVTFAPDTPPWKKLLLADAMTSGGLLAAVKPDSLDVVIRELQEVGQIFILGRVKRGSPHIWIV